MSGVEHTSGLSDDLAKELVESYEIVPFYGGIKCSYSINISADSWVNIENIFDGQIYISFSGAEQEYNLKLALEVFRSMDIEITSGLYIPSLAKDCGTNIRHLYYDPYFEDELVAKLWRETFP